MGIFGSGYLGIIRLACSRYGMVWYGMVYKVEEGPVIRPEVW